MSWNWPKAVVALAVLLVAAICAYRRDGFVAFLIVAVALGLLVQGHC